MSHCDVEWADPPRCEDDPERHSCVRGAGHKGDHLCGCGESLCTHPDDPPEAAVPATSADVCCDSHATPVCCDPIDCGPCCPACPTCPALHPEFLSWLTDTERRSLAATALSQAHQLDDPRYWGTVYPPPDSERTPEAVAARNARQLRWAHLAAVLDPYKHGGAPLAFYRQHTG